MRSVSPNRSRHAWEYLVGRSGLRLPGAAEQRLGSSEAQSVASRCGMDVVRLKPAWPELFGRIRALGPTIAVTRNAGAALVKAGVYALPAFAGGLGRVAGSVDLRLFTPQWGDAFALTGDRGLRTPRCVRIFDRYGEAVHTIVLHPEASASAFADLVWNLHADDQSAAVAVEPLPSSSFSTRIDADGLRDAVRMMSGTHEFGTILRRFNIAREHALRVLGSEYAWRVEPASIADMLRRTALSGRALTCFVENAGMLHIRAGSIKRVAQNGGWTSVLDADFNVHLHEASVANVWILRKPTRNGFVTSVEAYDRRGSLLIQFFGCQEAEGAEGEHWRALTAALPRVL